MSIEIDLSGSQVEVRLGGGDVALCLARTLRVPLASITGVRVEPTANARKELGWRIGGGYFPGLFATGWFTWRSRRGFRQWWRVYRGDRVLMIDTDRRSPARLVMQVADPDGVASRLDAALRGRARP